MHSSRIAQAEADAVNAVRQQQANRRSGRRVYVLGIDATPYVGMRRPGIDSSKIFDIRSILKVTGTDRNGQEVRGNPNSMYLWKDPNDGYTINMCNRGIMRPVKKEDVDMDSPYANVEMKKILTSKGPRQVVRTPAGLGAFEVMDVQALSEADKANLPGDHWEHAYLGELAQQGGVWQNDIEQLNQNSLGMRLNASFSETDRMSEVAEIPA